jgi:hypothetical protein
VCVFGRYVVFMSCVSFLFQLSAAMWMRVHISQTMAFGAGQSGGSVVAVLELARLFSKLYAAAGTDAPYNLLFLFTGASKIQGAGIKHWLNTADPRTLSMTM